MLYISFFLASGRVLAKGIWIYWVTCGCHLVTFYIGGAIKYIWQNLSGRKFSSGTTFKLTALSNLTIGTILRNLREAKSLLLREVAASISIDPTLLSKIERDERMPTREQVKSLSTFYKDEQNFIVLAYLSDKIVIDLGNEELALQAMRIAENKLKDKAKPKKK
jgi:HTH-type transcriptional regulator, competence development regulator